ncbi:MAG: hypothetical protein EOP04_18650 [Proteobacteria bacterium]|nr:MAG: hypothetical protein EOP04_18650 [Pseudomonadota bacterium]
MKTLSKLASLALFASVLSTQASAHGSSAEIFNPDNGHYEVVQKLNFASSVANSLVQDLNNEIAYIQNPQVAAPQGDCSFCTDEGTVEENDKLVVQHLLVISQKSAEIGRLGQLAAGQIPSPAGYDSARLACDLTNSVLGDIPNAKAAVTFPVIGVARPQTFDLTETKLRLIKTLLPFCY